ncbi:uncharacterized protein KNAG_0H02040 [Huiozyma naganishii CBS 8797]|uniref:Uncharacterized protein n=1 Tax=Huiozyma naganishii (strain ATCC MYA-139 / BCRC 22969 / CBS 8797 / KCTC 17520 / NBRC 10181 / NCYC 3082 / Yp74L-3) TaxID=1071383 RepID=J7RPI2_HUIN7|nr:hypothetical protein KNAG_0H02040 [Kazachstania naganishii CBS 8797]CCK71618.1 hypothetical protein KNAG_0H02040 [Kazachstania naganishii CBS 8797]
MSQCSQIGSYFFGSENWCFQIQPLYKAGILTSLSNGEVHLMDWKSNKSINKFKSDETAINALQIVNTDWHNETRFITASMHAVKLFDVRSNACIGTIHNEVGAPFLSLDSRYDKIACGTELKGVDAQLHIFDLRKLDNPWKSLVDSHHDDITSIKFHPSDCNVLLSGSTDGYTNIYDLSQEEEDDSLHQVINFTSIHSCGWVNPKRIYTLSHMETFAIHELNNKSDELTEPQPLDFGDIRAAWGCDYVVDIYPGYVATGKSHEEGKGELKLIPLKGENVVIDNTISIPSAHGDEVIRDVFIPEQNSEVVYSCGEDGYLNIWRNNSGPLNVPEKFWNYDIPMNVLDESLDSFAGQPPISLQSEPSAMDTALKSETKKHKKKKEKRSKEQKHPKSQRYKPY